MQSLACRAFSTRYGHNITTNSRLRSRRIADAARRGGPGAAREHPANTGRPTAAIDGPYGRGRARDPRSGSARTVERRADASWWPTWVLVLLRSIAEFGLGWAAFEERDAADRRQHPVSSPGTVGPHRSVEIGNREEAARSWPTSWGAPKASPTTSSGGTGQHAGRGRGRDVEPRFARPARQWMQSRHRGPRLRHDPRGRRLTTARSCGIRTRRGALGRHSEAVEDHEERYAQHQQMQPGLEARSRYDLASRSSAAVRPATSSVPAHCSTRLSDTPMSSDDPACLEQAMAQAGASGCSERHAGDPHRSTSSPRMSPSIDRSFGQHADHDGQVTICFSDIVGYTSMTDRLGDHRTPSCSASILRSSAPSLLVHRGVEVKSEGDGFVLAFRDPDDALASPGRVSAVTCRPRLAGGRRCAARSNGSASR